MVNVKINIFNSGHQHLYQQQQCEFMFVSLISEPPPQLFLNGLEILVEYEMKSN
jgi:hypothetical protein